MFPRFERRQAPRGISSRLGGVWGAGLCALALLACSPERPPGVDRDKARDSSRQARQGEATLVPERDQFVLTYAAERGQLADATTLAEVPESARSRVGVNVLGVKAPPGKIWVANLDEPEADGSYRLEAVPREDLELEILGAGRSSSFALPEGLDPVAAPGSGGPIVVYKTSWCGVCKQLEAYLQKKGVEYVAKDIEKDRAAAAELAAKAKAAGVPTGSVPMIDVNGELLRGFDRRRLDKLL